MTNLSSGIEYLSYGMYITCKYSGMGCGRYQVFKKILWHYEQVEYDIFNY